MLSSLNPNTAGYYGKNKALFIVNVFTLVVLYRACECETG